MVFLFFFVFFFTEMTPSACYLNGDTLQSVFYLSSLMALHDKHEYAHVICFKPNYVNDRHILFTS